VAGDGERRAEILDTAARLIAATGVRTSLHDIADACGILAGSLYHHFESKEAIVAELVQRFHDDLDRIAADLVDGIGQDVRPLEERVIDFGTQIADCAVRHRAALLITFFETPYPASADSRLVFGTPASIHAAMLKLLEGGARDFFRDGMDLAVLADRLCQSMLHVGIGVYHQSRAAVHVPAMKCRIVLHGMAAEGERLGGFDTSAARRAADAVIATWADRSADRMDDRAAMIRAAARGEIARRGFDVTTMRDIAAAAGVSTGGVYRLFESKDELLVAIMGGFLSSMSAGWQAIDASSSGAAEKLDALLWFNVNVIDTFREEHQIQSTWLSQRPPTTPDLPLVFPAQLRTVKRVTSAGVRTGEFRPDPASLDLRARCLMSVVWTPGNIVEALGPQGAHRFARDTVLTGAVRRSGRSG
jgi:AcrR family transcriptional regulator